MKIAFIGIGKVGFPIANRLQQKGHEILIANNDPQSESVQHARSMNPSMQVLPVQTAIDASDIVVLATPFQVNAEALKGLHFGGKTLVDCTNPVGPGITHGLKSERSGSEMVQELASDAKVVKAFSIYGFENLEDSTYPAYKELPAMLIAGDDAQAKTQVTRLVEDMGFESVDVGPLSQALHLEHMTLLWVHMVRLNGHSPNFVWAMLKR